ncbi:MAG: iron-containing alcohol dehydrogenase [Bacteroidales bacterium]
MSRRFNYHQPTQIRFGRGRVSEVGDAARSLGERCLLVTAPAWPGVEALYDRVTACLRAAGLSVSHFDGVEPNPTTSTIGRGAAMARAHGVDVVVGLGGGSSMDSAKAIAVEATHPGSAWDYLFYKTPQPDCRTLPVVAVTTTSGTGSQVTQVAVITNTDCRDKSALYNSLLYPRVAIVDPELMATAPAHLTASTGFDAFTHAFESFLHCGASPYTDIMALEAVRLIVEHLPAAVAGADDAREAMAWADTLAGHCIANAGVTLPHGIGMAIGGMYPHVMHGEALAVVYRAVMRNTWTSNVRRFATLGRLLDRELQRESDETAAERLAPALDAFLQRIGMALTLDGLRVPREELPALAKQSLVLPDYKNHPQVVTLDEVTAILEESFR